MIESSPRPKSLESLEGHSRCRITVNNIVQTAHVEGEAEPVYFAILDPRRYKEKGEKRWQPLGGAIRLTAEGHALVSLIGGEMFEKPGSKDSDDARFSIPTEKFTQVMELFSRLRPVLFEDTAQREVFEELSEKEFEEFPPILSEEDAAKVTCVTQGVLNEPPRYEGVAGRFAKDMPYARVTYLSSVSVPKDVFEKMKSSPLVHVFSKSEVDGIIDARMEGKETRAANGDALATTTLLLSKNPSVSKSEEAAPLYAEHAELEYAIFFAIGTALKAGRNDFEQILRNLTFRDGRPTAISDADISKILTVKVPAIQALVMDTV
jgi:hypothetical protein